MLRLSVIWGIASNEPRFLPVLRVNPVLPYSLKQRQLFMGISLQKRELTAGNVFWKSALARSVSSAHRVKGATLSVFLKHYPWGVYRYSFPTPSCRLKIPYRIIVSYCVSHRNSLILLVNCCLNGLREWEMKTRCHAVARRAMSGKNGFHRNPCLLVSGMSCYGATQAVRHCLRADFRQKRLIASPVLLPFICKPV